MHIQVTVVSGCHVVELAVLSDVNLSDGSVIVCGNSSVVIGVVASLVSVSVHRGVLSCSSFSLTR